MADEIESTTVIGCPSCGAAKTRVSETRTTRLGWLDTKVRRHACDACGHTYRTAEIPLAVAQDVFSTD